MSQEPSDPQDNNPPDGPPAQKTEQKRLAAYRDKILEVLAVGFPVALLNAAFSWLVKRTTSQPWQVIWYLIPVAAATLLFWKMAGGRKDLRLRGPFLTFLILYVLTFSVAAGSGFLDFQRTMVGFKDVTPSNWLGLSWLGDWRYAVAPRKAASPANLVIVTVDPPSDAQPDSIRGKVAILIARLAALGAEGIALDFHFEGETKADSYLCDLVNSLKDHDPPIPVFVGRGFGSVSGRLIVKEFPKSLGCFPDDRRGHLVGFTEADGIIRSLPLFFRGEPGRPALSLQVARGLGANLEVSEDELLYFIPPTEDFPKITEKQLWDDPEQRKLIRENFVLVGEASERDSFETPFGRKSGIVIHSYAIHSLRRQHFIHRKPWWTSFPAILILCYLLTLSTAAGASWTRLVVFALLASLVIVVASALAIWLSLLWIEVSYSLAALWLLLPLLLGLRRILAHRQESA